MEKWVGGGGILLAFTTIMSMVVAVWKTVPAVQAKHIREQVTRIRLLEEKNAWCEYRVSVLIHSLQKVGVPLPDEVFLSEEDFNARQQTH